MLKTAVNAIAAALVSNVETTIEWDGKDADRFPPIEEFLSLLSAYVITDPVKGEALVYPVRTVNWRQVFYIHGADRDAFFLIAGAAAKLNLTVIFEGTADKIKKEELDALTMSTSSLVQFLIRDNSIMMSSALGGDGFDSHARIPVPFVAGLILGSILGKKMTVLHLGPYFPKVLIKQTVHTLQTLSAKVETPMGSSVVIISHRGEDFDCENGRRLQTMEEKEDNFRRMEEKQQKDRDIKQARALRQLEKMRRERKMPGKKENQ